MEDTNEARRDFLREASAPPPEGTQLDIKCQREWSSQDDSKSAASQPAKPVAMLFNAYASNEADQVECEGRVKVMAKGDVEALLEDVGVIPTRVRRYEAMRAVETSEKDARAKGLAQHPMKSHVGLLMSEFVEALARIALLAFPRQEWTEACDCLSKFLLLDTKDTRLLRSRIAHMRRLRPIKMEHIREEQLRSAAPSTDAFLHRALGRVPSGAVNSLLARDESLAEHCPGPFVESDLKGVDLGTIPINHERRGRVVVRSRDLWHPVEPRIDLDGDRLPHAVALYGEWQLVTGCPRVIEIRVRPTEPGSWLGWVRVELEGFDDCRCIPIYYRALRRPPPSSASA